MDKRGDDIVSRRRWVGAVSASIAAAAIGRAVGENVAAGEAISDSSSSEASAGTRTYNVRQFGAKGDGATLDTKAIQAAIDACANDQGGTVLVPAGVFLIGPVELKTNVTLRICAGGKLLGTADGKQYHPVSAIPLSGDSTLNDGNYALLYAVEALNVTIEGPGTLDGNGDQFRARKRGSLPPSGLGGLHRPYSMLFYRCRNLRIRDIEVVDSAYHAIRVIQSTYIRAENIHIHSRVNGNNDGFHFISAQHVNVSNCNVESQDDACALFGSCQYVTITNCSFSTRWSVFRFGGGDVKNIAVSNCIIYVCYGCPIKIHCTPGCTFENMSFSNLVMEDVTGPISIGVGPPPRKRPTTGPSTAPAPSPEDEQRSKLPAICRCISFNNIRATVPSAPPQLPDAAVTSTYRGGEIRSTIALNCIGENRLEDISLNDVHIVYGGGGTAKDAERGEIPAFAGEYFELGTLPAYGLYARNVHGLNLRDVRFEVGDADLRPALVLDRVNDAAISGLSVQGNPDAESALRFIDSTDTLLSGPRLLTPAAVFLRVEGDKSESITVDGGDVTKATQALAFASGAEEKAVRMRG
jgi:hypothetical protein